MFTLLFQNLRQSIESTLYNFTSMIALFVCGYLLNKLLEFNTNYVTMRVLL